MEKTKKNGVYTTMVLLSKYKCSAKESPNVPKVPWGAVRVIFVGKKRKKRAQSLVTFFGNFQESNRNPRLLHSKIRSHLHTGQEVSHQGMIDNGTYRTSPFQK